MKLHIQIKNPEKLSPSIHDILTQQITFHAQKSMELLSIPELTLTVFPDHTLCIPETGEGGYTPSEHEMEIYIDPTKSDAELTHIIENIIPSTIYHEAHHAAQWINPGYGDTLIDRRYGYRRTWMYFCGRTISFIYSPMDDLLRRRNNQTNKNCFDL